jgi:hypothetical protein
LWREPTPSASRRFEELTYEQQAYARGEWQPVFVPRDDLIDPE